MRRSELSTWSDIPAFIGQWVSVAFFPPRVWFMQTAFIVVLFACPTSLPALADDSFQVPTTKFKGMELYSWQDATSGSWHYSLLDGTNRDKSLKEIKDPKVIIANAAQLKKRLALLASGEQIFWFVNPKRPELSYPSQEVLVDLVNFSTEHNLALHVSH